jgi:hypothetical protein
LKRLLSLLARGDVFAEDHDARDLARLVTPWPHFPAEPLDAAVDSLEAVGVGPHHLTRQGATVDSLPVFGDLREDFIVRQSFQVTLCQIIIAQPPAADAQVAHFAIEHCQ